MPKANTIHAYLKEKLKAKGLKLDNLVENSSFSRSTIYRVFNGYQKPSDDFLTEIIDLLRLNVLEQRELQYYSTLTSSDEGQASTREEIFRLIYQSEQSQIEPIEMIYMDNEKYILTLKEVLERLLKLKNFECRLTVMNCCKREIIDTFADFTTRLNKQNSNYEAEHYIEFSAVHDKDNIVNLSRILPVLCIKNYNVYYRTTESVQHEGLFYDLAFLDYQYTNENEEIKYKHLIMSFVSNGFSTCVSSDRPITKDFVKRNVDSVKNQYTLLTNNTARTKTKSESLFELEHVYEKWLFKPDISHVHIPMEAYLHILSRATDEQSLYFASVYTQEKVNKENMGHTMMQQAKLMSARQKTSYDFKQVDIMTKSGLESFISTGLLIDHVKELPAFDHSEIAFIIEEIIRRDKDIDDPFSFYILSEDYYKIDYLIEVFDGYGLYIEHYHSDDNADEIPFCFIKHERISEVFIDFMDNYVPNMLAMPKEESYEFLYGLLEKYNIPKIDKSE